MNAKITVFIGSGFAAVALALAGPAEAAAGHSAPGHSGGGGVSAMHVGMQPTSLSADTNLSMADRSTSDDFASLCGSPMSSGPSDGSGACIVNVRDYLVRLHK